ERGEGAEQRLAWLFRAATARCPEPTELALLVARYEAALARFAATPAAADELLAVGASAVDPSHPRAQLAATAVVASIVLNLDEVLTRP
ncbi:MAG: hypothetical protein KDE27_10960, partial [Planctomycetes bacterium]|nr:hypothetical protein [Planctomycetota bacterium]